MFLCPKFSVQNQQRNTMEKKKNSSLPTLWKNRCSDLIFFLLPPLGISACVREFINVWVSAMGVGWEGMKEAGGSVCVCVGGW